MAPRISEKQVKLIFKQKKTYYKSFVKVVLDIEGVQKENFEKSILDFRNSINSSTLNDKEEFL